MGWCQWFVWRIDWSYSNKQSWCWFSVFHLNSWTFETLSTCNTDNRVQVKSAKSLSILSKILFRIFHRSRFYFLTTSEIDLYGKSFSMPFVRSVWFCLCAIVALVSLVLGLIKWRDASNGADSFFLTSFGIFCQQGSISVYFRYHKWIIMRIWFKVFVLNW